jgi:hypothetical protein
MLHILSSEAIIGILTSVDNLAKVISKTVLGSVIVHRGKQDFPAPLQLLQQPNQ